MSPYAALVTNVPTIDVILPLAIADTLTYRVPASVPLPQAGMRVTVPLGKNKMMTGVMLREHPASVDASIRLRDIVDVQDTTPSVTADQLTLWQWIASYYMCSLGEVLAAALPAGIIDDNYTAVTQRYVRLADVYQQEQNLHRLLDEMHKKAPRREHLLLTYLQKASVNGLPPYGEVERRVLMEADGCSPAILHVLIERDILVEQKQVVSRLTRYNGELQPLHTLDDQQQQALQAVHASWTQHGVTLLHGVTSSGKTEVYMHLIDETLHQGQSVLYLVPEIALTTQLTNRLQCVFGNRMVVYHSRFSADERVEIYRHILQATEPMLIIGARSAVLLPFRQLGLVIVDEEHETSYKQQDPAPRYHARSVAIMLAQMQHAKVLLGTATPSVESYANALSGKYGLVEMTQRYRGLQLPRTTLIDLKRQYHRREMYGHFSDPLVERMREEIAHGKQVILFLNRRGYAPLLECPDCGFVPRCGNCDVSLTYHKYRRTLVCHYCGNTQTAMTACPQCNAPMREQGCGTERIEEEIATLFPQARVGRMDLDTTRRKDAYQQLIDDFSSHQLDILIGTQMVTKGLHFDDVSLVAVLNADNQLNQPDFRSTERAFQMLEQVSGRAGRTGDQGEVIIQTFDVNNPLYDQLKRHDYKALFEQQASDRERFHFPPCYRLIVLTIKHHEVQRLEVAARLLHDCMYKAFGTRTSTVLWPAVSKVQNLHIRQIRLTVETNANITTVKRMLMEYITYVRQQKDCLGVVIQPDVDPL